jgi:hypothetical protein
MLRNAFDSLTGTHITIMVVSLLACVGFSGSLVAAVAYTNAALYDPATGRRGFFDANRALRVSDAAGPLTVDGLVRVADGSGPLTVDGSVIANDAAPANFFRISMDVPGSCTAIVTPPRGKAAIVDSFMVDTWILTGDSPGSGKYVGLSVGPTGNCNSRLIDINPPGIGFLTIPFRPGIAIPNGWSLHATSAGIASQILLLGRYVAAATVPVPTAAQASSNITAQPANRLAMH